MVCNRFRGSFFNSCFVRRETIFKDEEERIYNQHSGNHRFCHLGTTPFYTSYFGWEEQQKTEMLQECKDSNNAELCNCVDESIFKEYTNAEYKKLDKSGAAFKEFVKETKEDCLDDSWF